MKKYKILLTRSMLPVDQEYIKNGLDNKVEGRYDFVIPSEFTEAEIKEEAKDADILLGPYVTKDILESANHLKLIQVPWTGMDTFNFDAVQDINVPICNTHSNADSVAELGVTLVLDLLKKVSYHDRKMRAGNWNRDQKPLNLKSRMLSKQTVCLMGCGNIGYRMAKLISAFGATVIAVDGNRKVDEIVSEVYKPEELGLALEKSDIAISTLPLTDQTRHLISQNIISEAKDGIIFVNMSRAEVIDENDIYGALINGKVAGFASDVWWNAPKRGESASYPSVNNEFWKLDNVIMSPHRAGFIEGSLPHLDGAIENIINLITGMPLNSVVDKRRHF